MSTLFTPNLFIFKEFKWVPDYINFGLLDRRLTYEHL